MDQNAIGSFDQIGYDAPNSQYFTYSFESGDTWTAKKGAKGPDCGTDWTVKSELNGANKAKHTPTAGCPNLTPNFANIGGTN